MHHQQSRSRGRRIYGKSLSTVNLGLHYGLQLNATSALSRNEKPPKPPSHDDSHGQLHPPKLTQRSFSTGLTRSRIASPHGDEARPSSEEFYFIPLRDPDLSKQDISRKLGRSVSPYYSRQSNLNSQTSQHAPSQPQQQHSQSASVIRKENSLDDGRSRFSKSSSVTPATCSVQIDQPASYFYLPGDKVLFSESSTAPGIPMVYRLADERQANPDKLNLDRRGLTVCPILEGEDNLRLLNFQHNLITKIQHLSSLKKLIFLDFYDNRIEEISGLSSLRSIRVLMLGKNRIKKISNLHELTKLDVLDLHGNQITSIDCLSHLKELRVLNLAGNEVEIVKNLSGLKSLAELNLRRNKISTVIPECCLQTALDFTDGLISIFSLMYEIDRLPCLQRLFLSYNDIRSFGDIHCLSKSSSLTELSLDGNPIADETSYKQTILQNVLSIKQLDMRKINDEERRIALVMGRKVEERRRETEKIASLKEKRQLAISNAQKQWELRYGNSAGKREMDTKAPSESLSHSSIVSDASSSQLSTGSTDYSVCHLAELDGGLLNLYGPGALEAIDRNWGEKAASAVTHVTFSYISFDDIAPHLGKLQSRFTAFQSLSFKQTNINHLSQINALAVLRRLESLTIVEAGNPIASFTLWKPYTLFRLSHLSLRKLNAVEIMTADIVHAEKLFGSLGHVTTSQLSQSRLLMLLGKQCRLESVKDTTDKTGKKSETKHERSSSGESISHAGLIYCPNSKTNEDKQEEQQRKKFAKSYIVELVQNTFVTERKRSALEKIWPSFFSDLVRKTVNDMSDMDKYIEVSLEKIKAS